MYIFRRKEKKSNKNQITLIGINSIKVRENSTTSVIILNVNIYDILLAKKSVSCFP